MSPPRPCSSSAAQPDAPCCREGCLCTRVAAVASAKCEEDNSFEPVTCLQPPRKRATVIAVKVLVPSPWVPTSCAWMKAGLGGSLVPIIRPAQMPPQGRPHKTTSTLPQTAALGISS